MLMKVRIRAIALAVLAILLVTACGQKKALYLPPEAETNSPMTEQETPTESTKEGPV